MVCSDAMHKHNIDNQWNPDKSPNNPRVHFRPQLYLYQDAGSTHTVCFVCVNNYHLNLIKGQNVNPKRGKSQIYSWKGDRVHCTSPICIHMVLAELMSLQNHVLDLLFTCDLSTLPNIQARSTKGLFILHTAPICDCKITYCDVATAKITH